MSFFLFLFIVGFLISTIFNFFLTDLNTNLKIENQELKTQLSELKKQISTLLLDR